MNTEATSSISSSQERNNDSGSSNSSVRRGTNKSKHLTTRTELLKRSQYIFYPSTEHLLLLFFYEIGYQMYSLVTSQWRIDNT